MPAPERVRAAARAGGLAAGLRCVLDAGRPVPCSPRGRAVLPASGSRAVRGWRLPGRVVPAAAARVDVLPHPAAEAAGLEVVEVVAPVGSVSGAGARDAAGRDADALAVAAARIGAAEAALDRAVARLTGRLSDGAPLIGRQLVRGSVADAAAALELCAADGTGSPGVHRTLTEAEWTIARLFGGHGYLLGGPAADLYLARLVGDAWTAPAAPGGWW